MAKIPCPSCGAIVDTDTGAAELPSGWELPPDPPAAKDEQEAPAIEPQRPAAARKRVNRYRRG